MIKKILITLIILLFICGCINGVQESDKETSELETPEMGFEEPETELEQEQTTNEFTIGKNKFILFNNKKVKIEDLNYNNEMTLSVDGKEMVFYQTKLKEIFQDLEITPLEFHFNPEEEKTYALLEINEFEPEENQYLMYLNQQIEIANKGRIILKDVLTDNLESIILKIVNEQGSAEEKIHKGETIDVLGIKITNIHPRPRPIGYEKYAIIQVE